MTRGPAPRPELGDRLSLSEREVAKLISKAERGESVGLNLTAQVIDGAHVIGVTGPPGAGKSTLVDALARELRTQGNTVAILAIDPSSHVSGGAVLGDRVRMSSHAQDPGIYIRSMATRGATSGLAGAAREAVSVLESAGYDVVIVETVGVGQVEIEFLTVADTVAVVLVPGLGDTMQMNKAGIMETGDVFVVNMADREETPRFVRELKQALALGARDHRQIPPVCPTVAITGKGVSELSSLLTAIEDADRASGGRSARRREQRGKELEREVLDHLVARVRTLMATSASLAEVRDQVFAGAITPRAAAEAWLEGLALEHD